MCSLVKLSDIWHSQTDPIHLQFVCDLKCRCHLNSLGIGLIRSGSILQVVFKLLRWLGHFRPYNKPQTQIKFLGTMGTPCMIYTWLECKARPTFYFLLKVELNMGIKTRVSKPSNHPLVYFGKLFLVFCWMLNFYLSVRKLNLAKLLGTNCKKKVLSFQRKTVVLT